MKTKICTAVGIATDPDAAEKKASEICGSPVVNTAGEFVGIIFDGNLHSLVLDFAYEDERARALSVDCRAIIEAMRKVYGVDALVAELLNGKRG